jgi:Ca-activated chloride channel family protein
MESLFGFCIGQLHSVFNGKYCLDRDLVSDGAERKTARLSFVIVNENLRRRYFQVKMLRNQTNCCVVLFSLFFMGWAADAQSISSSRQTSDPYTMRLPVDEVMLTFSAVDANGLPITDLKASEIRVWDNGVTPSRIVAFDQLVNRPIRVGVLLDTSESMRSALPANKTTAEKFVQRLFRQNSDAAFISDFGYASELIQSWTGNVALLLEGIRGAREKKDLPGGTALYNAVFRTCFYSFVKVDSTATGNFILLFSDGEDNSGQTSMNEAARACQRSNTQVYAFLPLSAQDHVSTGPRALRELVSKTGGRVFLVDETEAAIWTDLKTIESEMRNRYRLVYNVANFKHDGAFHEIALQPPDRVGRVEVRSGYFAPNK